jgi:hypothetical protein
VAEVLGVLDGAAAAPGAGEREVEDVSVPLRQANARGADEGRMIDASRMTTLLPGESVTVAVLPECPPWDEQVVLHYRVAHIDFYDYDHGDDAVFFDPGDVGKPALLTDWAGIERAYWEEHGVTPLDFRQGYEHLWLVPDA